MDNAPPHPVKKPSRFAPFAVFLVVLAFAGVSVGVLVGALFGGGSPASPVSVPPVAGGGGDGDAGGDNPYARFRFQDFALTDQDGNTRDQSILEGEVTAVSFFFTSCPGPCPAITRVLSDLQASTSGTGVRILSISVDGEHDTPERIRAYGQGFDADFDRWVFLTGDPADVSELARTSLTYTMRTRDEDVIKRPDGSRMANILHPTRIVLVGPDRRVIGLYQYDDPDRVAALTADANAAATNRPAGG